MPHCLIMSCLNLDMFSVYYQAKWGITAACSQCMAYLRNLVSGMGGVSEVYCMTVVKAVTDFGGCIMFKNRQLSHFFHSCQCFQVYASHQLDQRHHSCRFPKAHWFPSPA